MANLLNRSELKKVILALCETHRPACGFSRVSGEYMADLEADLRARIERDVHRHPSKGKTFGGPLVLHIVE